MFRTVKAAGIALLALLILVPAASAQRRGGFSGRFGFGRPVVAYPYGYNAWWPGWGWGWDFYYAPEQVPSTGNVKIVSSLKSASVYVDGGFAGRADKLKKFPLPLGAHDIELRDQSGHILHQERVQVIRCKTIEVDAG